MEMTLLLCPYAPIKRVDVAAQVAERYGVPFRMEADRFLVVGAHPCTVWFLDLLYRSGLIGRMVGEA